MQAEARPPAAGSDPKPVVADRSPRRQLPAAATTVARGDDLDQPTGTAWSARAIPTAHSSISAQSRKSPLGIAFRGPAGRWLASFSNIPLGGWLGSKAPKKTFWSRAWMAAAS